MRLRTADTHDIAAIAALHTANWQDTYRGLLSDEYLFGDLASERTAMWAERFRAPPPNFWVVVADAPHGLAGFACVYGGEDPEHGTLLENLHVAKAARGTGLGQTLVRAVARWSLEHHPGAGLHLWALEGNAAARRFYEQLGGVVTASGSWSPPVGPPVGEVRYSWREPGRLLPTSA